MIDLLLPAGLVAGSALLVALARRIRTRRAVRIAEAYDTPREGTASGSLLGLLLRGSAEVLGAAVALLGTSGNGDEDGLTTIMFCDVEDSTALNLRVGDARWADVLQQLHAVAEEVVKSRGGRVVKTQGDGLLAVFGVAADGVLAALGLQEAITNNPRIGETMLLRIGMHRGDVVGRAGDVFGTEVVKAARIADLARGGEVLISAEVHDQVLGTPGVGFTASRRRATLKGLPGRHDLHRAIID